MTATPIPRSLALVFYGDMDVSVLDEIPRGRGPVRTVLRGGADRNRIYEFILREIRQGRRAAIVYPLVGESERRDLKSAMKEAESLSAGPFTGVRVGLLHGRMSSDERCGTMASFSSGGIQVLVTTTVVEVGIDVPEASVMVVEHAERFGLSQLHQLRGRVGRGPAPSWCILIPADGISAEAEKRLRVVCETGDGFEISRKDLELRGPGELQGLRQAGDPGLRVASLPRDIDLLERAREEAVFRGRTRSSSSQ
jgi:ATP-dependent DNA helicase RecG